MNTGLICISLVFLQLTAPVALAANSSSGSGGSITIDALDPDTKKPIPDGLLRPGMRVLLQVHAYDSAGSPISCTNPTFTADQGFSGNQIEEPIVTQADGSGLMTMGKGFGSAEVKVRCPELPDVQAKMPVANNTLKTPAKAPPPEKPAETPPPAEAQAGSGGAALLGVAAAAGAVALAISLASSSKPCTPPDLYCRSNQKCCPSGSPYYCNSPSNLNGCYSSVFITGCTEKIFCTSEY